MKVFLSYASEDVARVAPIAERLEGAGITVWWDQRLRGGAEYARAIERELREADAVIVAWSRSSIESKWVRDEATHAAERDKLIPIRLDMAPVPLGFGQFHCIDFSARNGAAGDEPFASLLSALGAADAGIARRAFRFRSGAIAARRSRWIWPAVAFAAIAFATWSWWRSPPASTAQSTVRASISLPPGLHLFHAYGTHPIAVSRDGRHLAFVATNQDDERRLFVRPVDAFDAQALPGTQGADQPFFSPDGQWIGFFADQELRKAHLRGGAPITVTKAPGKPFGASWGQDGTILFSLQDTGLWQVPDAGGGVARRIPLKDANGAPVTTRVAWPLAVSQGNYALLSCGERDLDGVPNETGFLASVDLDTGTLRPLMNGSQAHHLATGHLVYYAGRERLQAVRFDWTRREPIGTHYSVIDGVFRGPASGAASFAVSENGTLLYVSGGLARELVLVDRGGRQTALPVRMRGYRHPVHSPDGRYLAVTVDPRPSHVLVIDLERGREFEFTASDHSLMPSWSPDGTQLAFASGNSIRIVQWPPAGEPSEIPGYGAPRWISAREMLVARPPWVDLMILDLATGAVRDFAATEATERTASVSPNQRWVAYTSDELDLEQVFVKPLDGSQLPERVSTAGGTDPKWSADGTELFYRKGNDILKVSLTLDSEVSVGMPELLFSGEYDFSNDANWDVLPDGRFVMIRAETARGQTLHLAVNWLEELETAASGLETE